MPAGGRARCLFILLQNLTLAAALYAAIYGTIHLAQSPSAQAKAKAHLPTLPDSLSKVVPDAIKPTKSGHVEVTLPGTVKTVTINPHANAFNRPSSTVLVKDDYLGARPGVDTEADLQMLVEECRGSYAGIEKMRNVFDCLSFLANGEERYYYLPEIPDRASAQDPRVAEYVDADGKGNTLDQYLSYKVASKSNIGQCNGPIIPYHVYWAGPATWRVEVFIKAYLHTQNLPCSRLWLWLDADRDPNAVDKMLRSDALFARFLPLVERGDIKVLAWNFPTRMPLPPGMDHTDGLGYYKTPQSPNSLGERIVADGIIEDASGQQWISLTAKQMTFFPQAISDAVRFVMLHLHGGLYLDMDVLLLRDMRPLLLPKEHAFAERWAAHPHPGDYNTAVMSLSANSSLSSYLLRGGVRMGLNFHPRVIGRMAWKDGRDQEFLMLETAAFDPVWTEFNWDREGRCTVPCLRDYSAAFKGKKSRINDEWESYDGEQLSRAEGLPDLANRIEDGVRGDASFLQHAYQAAGRAVRRSVTAIEDHEDVVEVDEMNEPLHSFESTDFEVDALRKAGVIQEYRFDEDKYPPSNRTMENFFKGAWTYHIHNQWTKHPEPSSWLAVMQSAHDRFFAGGVNPYGEHWNGPALSSYNRWMEFI